MEIILDNEVSKYEALVLERTNEGYTIFKNLDTDMVASIKNMTFNTEIFNYSRHKNSKVVQTLNDEQLLCLGDDGKYFVMDKESHLEAIEKDKLNQFNVQFSVSQAIKKTLGPL